MNSARIERMTREVNAEPAAQFFGHLVSLVDHPLPAVRFPSLAGLLAKIGFSSK